MICPIASIKIAAYFGPMIERTSKQSDTQTPTVRPSQTACVFRPVHIATINWVGLGTLYKREVQRFMKIAMQSVAAPVITSVLFLMVFSVAIGERANFAGNVDFVTFLVPGLVMMNVLQNAFANTSSSIVVSKVQGNIVDLLMPPLGPGELLFGLAVAGMTRGLFIGTLTALVLILLGGGAMPPHPLIALGFLILGAFAMSFAGIIAGIWANKFDELAAITNFVVQPLTFLSGTFYSVDLLTAPFDTIASLNPVFYTIDGFRYGMIGIADRPLLTGLVCLLAVNFALVIFCYKALHSGYRLKS